MAKNPKAITFMVSWEDTASMYVLILSIILYKALMDCLLPPFIILYQDHHTNMRLCSTTEMARLFKTIKTKSNALPSWLAHACPVARSNIQVHFPLPLDLVCHHSLCHLESHLLPLYSCQQGKICFVLLNDIPGHGNAGNIVTHS